MTVPSPQTAHPLAAALAARYREQHWTAPIIEIAAGSGRNTRFFVEAGIPIVSTRDDEAYTQLRGGRNLYAAALSTHGYLHGTVAKLRLGFAELRRVLRPGAPIFITLGSIKDARYGLGIPVDETTFAAGEGDEIGIPHTYFDRDGVVDALRPAFTIESMDERNVDDTVGRWAHEDSQGRWHWFVIARRSDDREPGQ